MYNLKKFKNKKTYNSSFAPWGKIIPPGIVINKDGSLMSVILYRGPDLDNETPDRLNIITMQINDLIMTQLTSGYVIYFEAAREIVNDYDNDVYFPDDITKEIDNRRKLMFTNTHNFVSKYYLTLYYFYNLQPKNTYKLSFIDDKNIRNNEVACMITLLEWIYNPGTGSVVEYKQGEAIRKAKSEETDIVKEYIKPLQDGMFEAAKIINEYMKYHPYEAFETKGYVYDLIRKTKTNPSKELVEAYYSMVFNDTFGTATYVEKDDKLSTMQKLNIFKCRDLLRKEMWKEAFIIHNDIEYMNALTGAKSLARKVLGKE